MGKKAKAVIGVAAVVLLAMLAFGVWPTRYRYDHLKHDGAVLPVRIDRLSGRTEMLVGARGWVEVGAGGSERSEAIEPLPPAQQVRVTGTGGLAYGTLFQGKLYNGSDFYLREILVTITARETNGELRWARQYKDEIFIESLTTGGFQIEVSGARGANISWSIDELKGRKKR